MKLTTILSIIFVGALTSQLYAAAKETAQPRASIISSSTSPEGKQLRKDIDTILTITRFASTEYNRYLINCAQSNDLKSLETLLDNPKFNQFISFAAIQEVLQIASRTNNSALANTIFDHKKCQTLIIQNQPAIFGGGKEKESTFTLAVKSKSHAVFILYLTNVFCEQHLPLESIYNAKDTINLNLTDNPDDEASLKILYSLNAYLIENTDSSLIL